MKKWNVTILALLLFFSFTPMTEASTIDEMKYYINNYYYEQVPKNLDALKTPKQISDALDQYSFYMTKEEFEIYKLLLGLGGTSSHDFTQSGEPTGKPSISSNMLYGKTGYISIENFNENLGVSLERHWATLKNKGAKTLIVDLRNNGGGYVESAQEMLGFFDGLTSSFHIKTRQGKKQMPVIHAKVKFPKNTYILMNRNSASASEMVAVSAKDQKAATIIGEKSFGKGTVQSFFNLTDQGVLKLTTGEFVGPSGTKVNKVGVTPNYNAKRNNEIQTAHRIILQQSLKPMDSPAISSGDKGITLNLPYKMNFLGSEASHQIELIQLGANEIPITIEQVNYQTVTITPKAELDPKAEYGVVIKSNIRRINGKRVKGDFYTPLTISTTKTETK